MKKAKKKAKKKAPSKAVAIHKPHAQMQRIEPPKNIQQVILEFSRDPKFNRENMKELMTQFRIEQERADIIDFNNALRETQEAMPPIGKDKQGAHGIPYASLENIMDRIQAIYFAKGFSVSFRAADSPLPNHYRLIGALARGPISRDYPFDAPADTAGPKGNDNKTPVQGIGSTMSYAQRRIIGMMFNLKIVGEDNDGAGPIGKPVSDKQLDELVQKADKIGVNKENFCKFMVVETFADIPAKRFKEAIAALNGFMAGKVAGNTGEAAKT